MVKKIILILAVLPSLASASELYMPTKYLFGFRKTYAGFEQGACALAVTEDQGHLVVSYAAGSRFGKPCEKIGQVYGIFGSCLKGTVNMTDVRLQCDRSVDGQHEILRLFNDPGTLEFSLINNGRVRHTSFARAR
ncbi:MAG: hypothetical protein ACKOX6_05065 [Bdellovibrio sp.]